MQVIKHEIVLITVFEIKIQIYNKLLNTISLNMNIHMAMNII